MSLHPTFNRTCHLLITTRNLAATTTTARLDLLGISADSDTALLLLHDLGSHSAQGTQHNQYRKNRKKNINAGHDNVKNKLTAS